MNRVPVLAAIPLAVFVAIGLFLYAGLSRETDSGLPSSLIGRPAAQLNPGQFDQYIPPDNEDLALESIKLVNFWASWCAPCRVEHPNLMALAETGIPIFGINYKDDEENAVRFLTELGNPFQKIGADSNGRVAINWGVYGVPETFLIDRTGTVRLRIAGPVTSRVFRDRILPVIEEVGGD